MRGPAAYLRFLLTGVVRATANLSPRLATRAVQCPRQNVSNCIFFARRWIFYWIWLEISSVVWQLFPRAIHKSNKELSPTVAPTAVRFLYINARANYSLSGWRPITGLITVNSIIYSVVLLFMCSKFKFINKILPPSQVFKSFILLCTAIIDQLC